jgi:hypothetical protein
MYKLIINFFYDIVGGEGYFPSTIDNVTQDYYNTNSYTFTIFNKQAVGKIFKKEVKDIYDDIVYEHFYQNNKINVKFEFYGKDACDRANDALNKINVYWRLHPVSLLSEGTATNIIQTTDMDSNGKIIKKYMFILNCIYTEEIVADTGKWTIEAKDELWSV